MDNKNEIGFLDWIINYKKYSDDYILLSQSYEQMKIDIVKEKKKIDKKLSDAENDFVNKEIKLNLKVKKLQSQLNDKANRILVLDDVIANRNNEIQELHKELAEVIVSLEKTKTSFNKIRGSIGGLTKENNKLKSINEFLKTNRRSPSKEEIRSYICQRKELEKRSKANTNEEKR